MENLGYRKWLQLYELLGIVCRFSAHEWPTKYKSQNSASRRYT